MKLTMPKIVMVKVERMPKANMTLQNKKKPMNPSTAIAMKNVNVPLPKKKGVK